MVREPELVKRVLDGMKVGGDFERSHLESFIVTALNGKGVHSLDGKKWAIDRQTLKPFFHQEALKVVLVLKYHLGIGMSCFLGRILPVVI